MTPKLKLLSLVLGGFITLSVYFGFAFAVNQQYNNIAIGQYNSLPKGIHAEEIKGMTHQVEYHYGRPLVFSWQEMLARKAVEFYPEDQVSYFPNPQWGIGSQIIIKRANQVVVDDAGAEKTYRTWTTNVGDFLAEKNIELGENDLINLAQDEYFSQLLAKNDREVIARDGRAVTSPMVAKIEITRVAITELKEKEEIAYKTSIKKDDNLERGIKRVEQEGKKGLKELVYEVRRENGQEVSRKLLRTEIVRQPVEKIVLEGTQVVVYGTGSATWYDWIGGMTAAHNSLPYGTMVRVVNLDNGQSVDVKIVDHGIKGSAIIDLSDDAFRQLAPLGKGRISVRLEKL